MANVETDSWAEMNAARSAGPPDLDLTAPRPLKLTIADLETLDRTWRDDALHDSELIGGRVYFTPARYVPRSRATGELHARLHDALEALGSPLWAGIRSSIAIPPFDLPLPDLLLTDEPRGEDFVPARSVPLVIEVVESALDYYAGPKAAAYARGGIAEYWIVDLPGRELHRFWRPRAGGYVNREKVALGGRVQCLVVAGLAVDTDGLG